MGIKAESRIAAEDSRDSDCSFRRSVRALNRLLRNLLKRCHMSLQFLGETGVYLPQQDAIRITALAVNAHIGCFATRSALEAIGCTPDDPPRQLVDRFEQNRVLFEIAAMIKYRRSTNPKVASLLISDEDLKSLEPAPRTARPTSAATPRKARRRPAHLR
jgi:hypothetical protein